MTNRLQFSFVLAILIALIGGAAISGTGSKPLEFNDGGVRAIGFTVDHTFQLPALKWAGVVSGSQRYEKTSTFLSEPLRSDIPFNAVGAEWEEHTPEGTVRELYLRFKSSEGEWSDWVDVEPSLDMIGKTVEGEDLSEVYQIVPTDRSVAVQYKVVLESELGRSTPRLRNVTLHFIDSAAPDYKAARASLSLERLVFGQTSPRIISRREWGADESWRLAGYYGVEPDQDEATSEPVGEPVAQEFEEEGSLKQSFPEEFALTQTVSKNEKGEALYWPLEYAKNIKKIVVHHTAGSQDLKDPAATVRAIYYYHSVRRGWGDIGYNYLIDMQGNIYEGRYGGEKVVAGHARGYNTGSIGIAVIGNYEGDSVPYPVIEALSSLIGDKATLHNIKVDGFSQFRGEVTANIMGHRDTAATRCPGQHLYDLLPALMQVMGETSRNAEVQLLQQPSDKDFEFANLNDYSPVVLKPEATSTLQIQLKNRGKSTWTSATYLVADQNPTAESLVRFQRVSGNATAIASMKEKSVAPGQTATFMLTAEGLMRGGFNNFKLTPVFNGTKKTTHYISLPVYVETPKLSYTVVENSVQNPQRIKAGGTLKATLKLKNTGNVSWSKDGAYAFSVKGSSGIRGGLTEKTVAPGAIGTVVLDLDTKGQVGRAIERLTPTIEGVGALKGERLEVDITVIDDEVRARVSGQSPTPALKPGEKKVFWFELENTGDTAWKRIGKNALTIGKTHPASLGVTKPIPAKSSVPPGAKTLVRFTVTAPKTNGTYGLAFRPRLGGTSLLKNPITFNVKVEGAKTATLATSTTTSTTTTTTATPPAPVSPDREIVRVKLGYDTARFGNVIVTAQEAFALELGGKRFLELKAGDRVEVRRTSDRYQILYDARAWVVTEIPRFVTVAKDGVLQLTSFERRPAWNPALNDNQFRGVIEVRDVEGAMTVINELPMDMYLRGLAEAPNGEPREKIRTMMILARTYARFYLKEDRKFPGKPYDLSDNPDESQKYLGYGFEVRAPNIVQAVADTKGKVVTYNGKLVKTPYFSSTDGTATRSAKEVWGWTHTPYLVSVPDPLCEAAAFSGHGVGLSGCGATAAAEKGFSYEEIIQYYYPGVEVEVK